MAAVSCKKPYFPDCSTLLLCSHNGIGDRGNAFAFRVAGPVPAGQPSVTCQVLGSWSRHMMAARLLLSK